MENLLYHKTYNHPTSTEWVTFIHGAGGSSSIWFRQIRDFKKNYNVLLIDLRGHGGSKDMPGIARENYSFNTIASEVLEVLNHLKIETSHFVGISLGTILVQTIADLEPNRVKSMVLGGAILRLDFRSKFLVNVGNVFKKVVPFIWLYKLFAWIIMPRKRHKKARLLFVNDAKKLCNQEFLKWYGLTFKINSFVKYLKESTSKIPVLYLMGDEDHMFLPPVKAILQKEAMSTLRVISNSGHVCNVDQPEAFNRFAMDFIDRQ